MTLQLTIVMVVKCHWFFQHKKGKRFFQHKKGKRLIDISILCVPDKHIYEETSIFYPSLGIHSLR